MTRSLNLLSIQSHVVYGHVGNASAVFPLQRLGHEVWPVHTVQFSNHTGYGAWRGQVFDPSLIDECVTGLKERGALARCDGVLSGYLGSAETGEAVLRALREVRVANRSALYCCDPVMGDVGRGIFVRPGITDFMRDHAVPEADVLTPNQFELELLAGFATPTMVDVERALIAVNALRNGGRTHQSRTILVTSLVTDATPPDCIDVLAAHFDGDGGMRRFLLRTPRLDVNLNGAGDAIAALFFAHLLTTNSPAGALQRAVSSVFGVLRRTVQAGSRELLTVAAQEEFVQPSQMFEVRDA
ncbi:pyridoxal kinase PdxY [Methylovirgula sp. 4M-Z18]|uniref:pyridoxal kinase PdxY n=1 Tax=Methylovirgula sp. 4M-Z18 TaxID=2293567 RepID=UPI000E2E54B0|nr:pyridoxal kinase PdxY [Methylovirgula sp. 4M-Z18]RFB75041.1 pyridoxal kinase PdxY [Methylovirgula sp. 4M-Z18]